MRYRRDAFRVAPPRADASGQTAPGPLVLRIAVALVLFTFAAIGALYVNAALGVSHSIAAAVRGWGL